MGQRRIYLDQAATSWPKIPAAVDAAEQFIRECGATSGRGAYGSARVAEQWVMRARHNLARLVKAADANDIAFCSSGTHALNAVLHGLLRPGSKVFTTAIEHNSVLRPLEFWRKNHAVEVTIAPSDPSGLVPPLDSAESRYDLAIVSHASNVTGRIQDLSAWREFARRTSATLIVDASQTLGYVPIDMRDKGIDVLVSAGHKGLGALSGTGFIAASSTIREQFVPLMYGGTGTASEQLDFVPEWPQSVEVGNLNLPAVVSMAVAAEKWLQFDSDLEVWRPGLDRFLSALRNRFDSAQLQVLGHDEPGYYLPVVSVLPSGWDIHEAAAVLDANFGIEVRAGFHCAALIHDCLGTRDHGGTLRMSLGHGTSLIDLDDTVHALSVMIV